MTDQQEQTGYLLDDHEQLGSFSPMRSQRRMTRDEQQDAAAERVGRQVVVHFIAIIPRIHRCQRAVLVHRRDREQMTVREQHTGVPMEHQQQVMNKHQHL